MKSRRRVNSAVGRLLTDVGLDQTDLRFSLWRAGHTVVLLLTSNRFRRYFSCSGRTGVALAVLPLTGFAVACSSLAHPGVSYVWGVPLDVILFTFITNTVFYATLSFLILSAFAIWKRRGALAT